MFRRRVKCAVLVDFDNIAQIVGAPFGENAQAWIDWFEDAEFDPGGPKRRIVRKMVYWNSHNEKRWRPLFEAVGFEAFNCPSLVKSKKSEADMRIALDAQRLAFEQKDIEEFAIISTDTDFVALLNCLAELDRRTIAVANKSNASFAIYSKHADFTIPVHDLRRACDYQRPPSLLRRWFLWWTIKDAAKRRSELGLGKKGPRRWLGFLGAGAARRAADSLPEGAPKGTPAMERAADIILDIAEDAPGLPVARRTIIRRMFSEMPEEFRVRGVRPYLGYGDYRRFLQEIARLRPSLRLHFYANGGAAVSFRE